MRRDCNTCGISALGDVPAPLPLSNPPLLAGPGLPALATGLACGVAFPSTPQCSGHTICLPQRGEMASELRDVSVAQPANKPTAFFLLLF